MIGLGFHPSETMHSSLQYALCSNLSHHSVATQRAFFWDLPRWRRRIAFGAQYLRHWSREGPQLWTRTKTEWNSTLRQVFALWNPRLSTLDTRHQAANYSQLWCACQRNRPPADSKRPLSSACRSWPQGDGCELSSRTQIELYGPPLACSQINFAQSYRPCSR